MRQRRPDPEQELWEGVKELTTSISVPKKHELCGLIRWGYLGNLQAPPCKEERWLFGVRFQEHEEVTIFQPRDYQTHAERKWSLLYLVSRFVGALSRRRRARNKSRKALNSWRTVSLLFEFLCKIRKCCEEAKKHRIVSTFRHPVIKNWQKGKYLGSGSFSTVYEAFTDNGFFFALKEVSLHDQDNQGRQNISHAEKEISLLNQFEHENIVRYLGSDKDDSKFYIFLELVTQGSLARLYQNYQLWDSQVSAYTRQILRGLNYLHGRNVIHRDIKCANILVDASGSVKLADFGLAKVTKLNDIKSCKGTPFWMAPEVVNLKDHGYGTAADIWSLGCTVLEMLTRQNPYPNLEKMQALFKIGRGEGPPVPTHLSNDARDFIDKCLQVKPEDRPTAAQLLEHSFVKNHQHI
ncbi:hypothetical protein Pfo_004972 [Paulownia fortunei]|nr:hypothetical protein Pfo_004972 [Paulownia fortunei]